MKFFIISIYFDFYVVVDVFDVVQPNMIKNFCSHSSVDFAKINN